MTPQRAQGAGDRAAERRAHHQRKPGQPSSATTWKDHDACRIAFERVLRDLRVETPDTATG
jgi:hypothetical protein